jgi:hypothetical protein
MKGQGSRGAQGNRDPLVSLRNATGLQKEGEIKNLPFNLICTPIIKACRDPLSM